MKCELTLQPASHTQSLTQTDRNFIFVILDLFKKHADELI